MENDHGNINQKKSEMVIFISLKLNFRAKRITRDRRGHYMIKGPKQQDTATLNKHATNRAAEQHEAKTDGNAS